MDHVASSKKLRSHCGGVAFKAMVRDGEEIRAWVKQTASDQVLISVNRGLLKATYEFLLPLVHAYHHRNHSLLDVDVHQFSRICLGACGLMIFWHEFAHAARGHLAYKDAEPGAIPARVREVDADIYGAQFFLAQISVVAEANPNICIATFARSYAIGIRGLFHVLSGIEGSHDDAPGSTHPNPISRAYIAFTHGLARAAEVGLSREQQDIVLRVGQKALLEFEEAELGCRIDTDVLTRFCETELAEWRTREAELIPYQLLKPQQTS